MQHEYHLEVFLQPQLHLHCLRLQQHFRTLVDGSLFNDLQHYSEFLADSRIFLFLGLLKIAAKLLWQSLLCDWQSSNMFSIVLNTFKNKRDSVFVFASHQVVQMPSTTCFLKPQVRSKTLSALMWQNPINCSNQ